jgi:hypothetical protein
MKAGLGVTLVVGLVAALVPGASSTGAVAPGAGSLDRSFGHGDRTLTDFQDRRDQTEAMAIDGDGRIIVAGRVRKPDSRSLS